MKSILLASVSFAALLGLLLVPAAILPPTPAKALLRNGGGAASGGGGSDALTTAKNAAVAAHGAGAWFTLGDNTKVGSVLWNCVGTCNPSGAPTASAVHDISGPNAIMMAWSGGALDTDDEWEIIWGGGHQDYRGNEIYAIKLATLTAVRLTAPSNCLGAIGQNVCPSPDPNGFTPPESSHTYDGPVYVPGGGTGAGLYQIGTCSDIGGGCSSDSFRTASVSGLSPTDYSHWVRLTNQPTFTSAVSDLATAYDPVTNAIYAIGPSGSLQRYALSTGVWTTLAGHRCSQFAAKGAINPGGGYMVVTGASGVDCGGQTSTGLEVYRLSDGILIQNGDADGSCSAITGASAPGFVWDPDAASGAGRFIGWNGGKTIYVLNQNTWKCTTVITAGDNPTCTNDAGSNCTGANGVQVNGTYGRFQYDHAHLVAIVVNTPDDPGFGRDMSDQ